MRRLMMAVAAMVAWCAVAEVPTQAEFTTAGNVISDLLEPQMAAVKSGKKKPAEVADYAMSLVGESDTAAAKFLLAKRAYGLYMKGGAYDKAVEAIGEMRAAVPDMPNERMLKAVQADAKSVSEKKAPAVYAIIADLRGKVRSQGEIVKLEGELKKAKVSEREGIHRQLGECHAVTGDWEKALEHFAKSGGDVAAMATAEAGGTADANKVAGFWWDYSEKTTVKKSVASACRQHAVAIYQKGLDDGTISGLNKKLAEQRVASSATADSVLAAVAPAQRVPKGLAHRWSFNGDVKDSVGGIDAVLGRNTKIENGQCLMNRGWVDLSGVASECTGDLTIEIWTTEIERSNGAFVFHLRSPDTSRWFWGWETGCGKKGYFTVGDSRVGEYQSRQTDCSQFDLGVETYVAMTCKEICGKYEFVAYKYDPAKNKLSSYSATMDKCHFEGAKWLGLGSRCNWCRGCFDAISSFNECRIWKRCLSKSEIERSAKAGPDKLVL